MKIDYEDIDDLAEELGLDTAATVTGIDIAHPEYGLFGVVRRVGRSLLWMEDGSLEARRIRSIEWLSSAWVGVINRRQASS